MANGNGCNKVYSLAIALTCFLFIFFVNNVHGRKTRDLIYQNIDGFSACVRRFNATHQTGCSTINEEGSTGVLHYVNDTSSLDWLLKVGPEKPYIPILTAKMFTQANIMLLWDSGKINGLMVIHTNAEEEMPSSFSPDYSCPNENYGWYTDGENTEYAHCAKIEWNPAGHKSQPLSYFDFQQTPIFALTSEESVDNLLQCYFKWNEPIDSKSRSYPLCAVELSSMNFGALDTPTCMRRTKMNGHSIIQTVQYCDPLGDYNIWGTINPTNKSQPLEKESVIVVASKLDSTSMFDSTTLTPKPGVENDVTGFIVALSIAEALGRLPLQAKNKFTRNIMFAFFQGETYDYIGSSRMVYDMQRGQFPQAPNDKYHQPAPMNSSHISHFVELGQLGLPQNNTYWLHTDPISQADTHTRSQTQALVNQMNGTEFGLDLQVADSDLPLPPASFQRFLRANTSIPGIVVTDHSHQFSNSYYNSRFDLSGQIGIDYVNQTEDYVPQVAVQLNNLSTTIAQSLYALAYPDGTDELATNLDITKDLLYCFLYKPNCSLFQRTLENSLFSQISIFNKPFSYYVSVYREGGIHNNTVVVQNLLEYFLGEKYPIDGNFTCSGEASDHILSYREADGDSVCVVSGVQRSIALSPAFELDQWDSTEYSTWTESSWSRVFSAKVFLVSSKSQQSTLLSIGVVVFLVSGLLIYFIEKKSAILFATEDLY